MHKSRLYVCFLMAIFCSSLSLFGQSPASTSADPLLRGLEAYSRSDWVSSVLFFRKAVSNSSTASPDAWYWLVMSENSAGDFDQAIADADIFLASYKDNSRFPDVIYQKGRALFLSGRFEESINQMYSFIKTYPTHTLLSSAYFWVAESLYELRNYDGASLLYKKILHDFPLSPKREASLYRVELIDQRAREVELLRLLKITHEESLRASEEYEKRGRNYEQIILSYQKRIAELLKETRVDELELALSREKALNSTLTAKVAELEKKLEQSSAAESKGDLPKPAVALPDSSVSPEKAAPSVSVSNTDLESLKKKAKVVQDAMDEQDKGGSEQ